MNTKIHKFYTRGRKGKMIKNHCYQIRHKRLYLGAMSILSHYDKNAKGIKSRLSVWAKENQGYYV